jgi:hypothetical protein
MNDPSAPRGVFDWCTPRAPLSSRARARPAREHAGPTVIENQIDARPRRQHSEAQILRFSR